MRSHDAAFDEWSQRARDRDILRVAQELGATLKRAGQELIGPCPACGGEDRFGINTRKRLFICRGSDGGGVISMVMHIRGDSYVQACEFLTGTPPPSDRREETQAERQSREHSFAGRKAASDAKRATQERKEATRNETVRNIARRLWDRSLPLAGTLAEGYLRMRGIDFPLDFPSLRFAPAMEHRDSNRVVTSWPALVCCVQGPNMHFRGIWRIYLNPKNMHRAPVTPDKAALGPVAGGAVWLRPSHPMPGQFIKRCEGVETGLGVYGIGLMAGCPAPVACCMSTSGLINFERPDNVERDVIYPDGDVDKLSDFDNRGFDSPGLSAAERAKLRSMEHGLTGTTIQPQWRHGGDYLDQYVTLRKEFLGK